MQLVSAGQKGGKGGLWAVSFGCWVGGIPLPKHTHQTEGQLNKDGTGASEEGYKTEANISSASCYHRNPGRGVMRVGQRGEQQAKVTREMFTEPSTKPQEYSRHIKMTDFLMSPLAYICFQCVTGKGKHLILQCSLVYPCWDSNFNKIHSNLIISWIRTVYTPWLWHDKKALHNLLEREIIMTENFWRNLLRCPAV